MILKIKAFIYRFSDIFGIKIYLANKEEAIYIRSLNNLSKLEKGIHVGLWQAKHGFTTIWTYKQNPITAFINKTKHAFDFKDYK